MSYDFSGKVVIITGSTSGIGEDAAINFSKCGAQIVVSGRNESTANVVAEVCKRVSPRELEPLVILADVSKQNDCVKLIQNTIEKFHRLDVLINNAAIYIPSNLASEDLIQTYDNIFTTNVKSVLLLTQLSVPHLEKTRGVIVNISSVGAVVGTSHAIPNNMSKAAINSLTKSAAIELGPKGIRVVSIK